MSARGKLQTLKEATCTSRQKQSGQIQTSQKQNMMPYTTPLSWLLYPERVQVLGTGSNVPLTALLPVPQDLQSLSASGGDSDANGGTERFLVIVTKSGYIKKLAITKQLLNMKRTGLSLMNVRGFMNMLLSVIQCASFYCIGCLFEQSVWKFCIRVMWCREASNPWHKDQSAN